MQDVTAHNLVRYSGVPNSVSYKRKYLTKYYSLEEGDILRSASQKKWNKIKARYTSKILRYNPYHSRVYLYAGSLKSAPKKT